jgi:hypothetical protein
MLIAMVMEAQLTRFIGTQCVCLPFWDIALCFDALSDCRTTLAHCNNFCLSRWFSQECY